MDSGDDRYSTAGVGPDWTLIPGPTSALIDTSHRRGRRRAARHCAGAIPRSGRAPAQICLPELRGCGEASARPDPADRGWPAHRGDGRPGSGVQVRRPPSALSPGADLRPSRRQAGSLDPGRLGRSRGLPVATGARASARPAKGILEAVCRRDDSPGSRSRPWPDKNRPALRLRPR